MMERAAPVERIDSLTHLEKQTLQFIVRTFGHSPFLLDQFLQKAPLDRFPAEWHIGLVGLCRRQIVSIKRKTWGERLFHVPVSFYFAVFGILHMEVNAALQRRVIAEEEVAATPQLAMPEKALLMMLELEREPLKLTQKGQIHQKCKKRLLSTIGKQQHTAEDDALSRALEQTLDLLLRMEIVKLHDGITAVQESRFRRWLAMDRVGREAEMFMIWYRVHCPSEAGLEWLTAAIRHAPAGRWVYVADLLQAMREAGLTTEAGSAEGWLAQLEAAGWVEAGVDREGRSFIRRPVATEETVRTLIIQPDFEVIAFPGTAFPVLRKLVQIGESLVVDVAVRVRLTQHSCQRANAQGMDAANITAFLEQHAIDHVPERVKDTIAAWERSAPRIRLMKGVLLHTESDAAAIALQMCCKEQSVQQIAPHYWLIAGAEEQAVVKMLKQSELYVEEMTACHPDEAADGLEVLSREPDREQSADTILQALRPDAPGLYTPSDVTDLYRSDDWRPSAEDVYPDHKRIPSMWYKQYRKYHTSTTKQLIEQAIAWRTGIRIRTEDRDLVVAPRAIDDTVHPCAVDGYNGRERLKLSLDRIEQIKLLLPGILE